MNNFDEKKGGQHVVTDAPTYQKFARDKRVRTTGAVKVEPVSRRENAENTNREGRTFNRDERSNYKRSYNNDRGSRPMDENRPRASYNPNFTRDNRPAFRSEESGEERPRRQFNRDFNRDGERRTFNRDGERRQFNRSERPSGFRQRDEQGGFRQRNDEQRPSKKPVRTKSAYSAGEIPESYPRFAAPQQDGEIRLNRYIAQSGLCSRREADELIADGKVTVNGVVVTEMGTKVQQTDEVCVNESRVVSEKKVYILMNKPKGYVTTVEDDHATKTVMDIVKGACAERIYPVGRLDKNSLGVLLMTNDGDLTKTLTHPSFEKRKVYQVTLDKPLTKADMEQIVEGITLDDGFIQADEVSYVNESKKEVGIEIHSGRNRIVRRIFEHQGYTVTKLDRVLFAGLTKKNLKRGQWRFLTPQEVGMLKSGRYE